MRKRNLIFPFVVSSLFMPSIEALERTTDLNSLESENNIYEAVDILIAEGGCGGGGGGGGGMSPKEKAEQEVKRQKSKDAAKKRIIKSKIAAGKPLTDEEKKIIELNPNDFPLIDEIIGGGPNSLAPMKKQKSTIINDYREAIEFNKNNKSARGKAIREFYKKVINLKKQINTSEAPKDGNIFIFLDIKYARLKQLDLIESFLVLLMSEEKKAYDYVNNLRYDLQTEYKPNIEELEKQRDVIKGINLSDNFTNSFKYDFDIIRLYAGQLYLSVKKLENFWDDNEPNLEMLKKTEFWKTFES